MVLDDARRRIRHRKAERLADRVRSRPPDRLAGVVTELRDLIAVDDGAARYTAVETLAALARKDGTGQAREDAVDALVDVLADGDPAVREVASPEARYVALERPPIARRLDGTYATLLQDGSSDVRRQVATDVGILVAEHGREADLGRATAALQGALLDGDRETRRAAATAYVLVAGTPAVVDDPGTVAEHLAILRGELDGPIPPTDSHLGRLAGDRSLDDAVAAFRDRAIEERGSE